MKRKTLLILAILLFVPVQTAFAKEKATYSSATEFEYPPFSVTGSGEADGFSVELLREVMNVMGLQVTFKINEWNIIKEELKNGEIDVLPLVGYTAERAKIFDFTVPYIVMHGNIFVRNNNSSIITEEDLYGKEIIVMDGDNAHEYAIRMSFTDNLILTKTYEEAFLLLDSGKYDAILAQSLVGEQLLNQLNIHSIRAVTSYDGDGVSEIKISLSGFEQKFCFAVKKGDDELLSKLNEGLAIVSVNGTYQELYNKWFPFQLGNKPTFFELIKASMSIVIPLIILTLLVSIIYTKIQINAKTKELNKSNEAILMMESHLRNQQKLESIGVLASGVAHEINNPLNGILNYSQIISDIIKNKNCGESSETINEYSKEIINETKRIVIIVKNLLQFSRNEPQKFAITSISEVINDTLSLINTIIMHDKIQLSIDIPDDLPMVECRSQQIQQVVMNLLTNGRDALNARYPEYHTKKKLLLKVEQIQVENKNLIRIIVEDRGNGIPRNIQDNIFDPFFTTKSRAEGTGLGLSISYGIIVEHNGKLSFETEEGSFTRFFIDLPINQDTVNINKL